MTLMVNICVAECGNNGFLAFMQSQLYKSFMCKLSHTLYTHVISYPAGPTFDDIPLCAANSNHLEVRTCNPPFQRRVWGRLKGARAKSQQEIPPHTHTHFFPLSFFLFPQCTVSCDPLLTDTGQKYVPESTTLQKLWNSRTLCIIVW